MNSALPDLAKTAVFRPKQMSKCIRNCVFPKSGDKITEELQKCIKKGLTRCRGGIIALQQRLSGIGKQELKNIKWRKMQ